MCEDVLFIESLVSKSSIEQYGAVTKRSLKKIADFWGRAIVEYPEDSFSQPKIPGIRSREYQYFRRRMLPEHSVILVFETPRCNALPYLSALCNVLCSLVCLHPHRV